MSHFIKPYTRSATVGSLTADLSQFEQGGEAIYGFRLRSNQDRKYALLTLRRFAMNKARFAMNVLVIGLFTLVLVPLAQAQATRTWVSGVGDDANPCSRTAPCKTFPGAISKTATGGEINVLDPGGFGAVTITKSITIDGSGGSIAGVLVSGTNAIVINAPATSVVTIRNLDINGLGTGLSGIRILGGAKVHIERCVIYGFSIGIDDVRTVGDNALLAVTDTTIKNNSNTAVKVVPNGAPQGTRANLDTVRLINNGIFGLVAGKGSVVTASNTIASGHGTDFQADGSPGGSAILNLEGCVASHAGTGINSGPGAVVRVSNTQVSDNGTGIGTTGGTFFTFLNNKITGNGAGNAFPGGTPSSTGQ
jgi:hypothetical protein